MKKYNIAICPSGGIVLPYIIEDIKLALDDLGHNTAYFPINPPDYSFDYKTFVDFFSEYKPDFSLMIGTNGMIPLPAKDVHFLDEQKVPYFSLNYDSPFHFLHIGKENLEYLKGIFISDRYHAELMTRHNVDNVFYLPLGTNPRRFYPIKNTAKTTDLDFIGLIKDEKYLQNQRDAFPYMEQTLIDNVIKEYLADPSARLIDILMNRIKKDTYYKSPLKHPYFDSIFGFIDNKLSTMLRKQTIHRVVSKYKVTVQGNQPWNMLENKNLTIEPKVPYSELLRIYNKTKINLNITSSQLATSINQRIFDCGACRNFVLTDLQEELYELFELQDVVHYKDKNDLLDKIEYYLHHETEREAVANRLYNKVLARHTWVHRMKEAMEIIGKLDIPANSKIQIAKQEAMAH